MTIAVGSTSRHVMGKRTVISHPVQSGPGGGSSGSGAVGQWLFNDANQSGHLLTAGF